MHDMSSNCTCDVFVCQPNVALAIKSKTGVSPDEGRTNIRLAPDDATLHPQSR